MLVSNQHISPKDTYIIYIIYTSTADFLIYNIHTYHFIHTHARTCTQARADTQRFIYMYYIHIYPKWMVSLYASQLLTETSKVIRNKSTCQYSRPYFCFDETWMNVLFDAVNANRQSIKRSVQYKWRGRAVRKETSRAPVSTDRGIHEYQKWSFRKYLGDLLLGWYSHWR